jgi:hypothetical protein
MAIAAAILAPERRAFGIRPSPCRGFPAETEYWPIPAFLSAVAERVRQRARRGPSSRLLLLQPTQIGAPKEYLRSVRTLIQPLPLWQPVLLVRRFSWRRCESIGGLSSSCCELESGGWLHADSSGIRRQMCAWAKEIYRGKVFAWLRKSRQSKKWKN